MKKVKIKTMPKTGTQKDYSLVHNTAVPASSNNTKESVRNTMTATNNGDENIEVENGETVIGDLNYDGLLELMSFQGKTHAEGGIPVNVPDGSFIYSNTPKMRIKDEDILKIFGMGKKKKGYTPAEISKQYQINDHIDTLKNEEADDISKKTAHQMLKNNTEKLAMLAIVQEGMKGFENGIPSFAENVMAGLQQGEGQPQMKYGGLPKAQSGLFYIPTKQQYNTAIKEAPDNPNPIGEDFKHVLTPNIKTMKIPKNLTIDEKKLFGIIPEDFDIPSSHDLQYLRDSYSNNIYDDNDPIIKSFSQVKFDIDHPTNSKGIGLVNTILQENNTTSQENTFQKPKAQKKKSVNKSSGSANTQFKWVQLRNNSLIIWVFSIN